MDLMTTKEAAERWSITVRRVQSLCEKGLIDGAQKLGDIWVMPTNAVKPIDGRTKDGKNQMKIITPEQMQKALSVCYEKAVDGLPVSKGVVEFAEEYQSKCSTPQEAAEKLVKNQIIKCGTSGFVTGFGGLITLPVTIPANLGSVMYIQLRMIAAIAYLGGYDPKDDAVQTMVYLCLVGEAVTDVVKQVGIKVGNRVALNALKKLPGKVLTRINQKVGMRLITKFGTKGVINLVKVVPVAGGVVGAGIDVLSTQQIAKFAMKTFIENPYNPNTTNDNADQDEVVDCEPVIVDMNEADIDTRD
jgi:hypothetical protein